LHYTNLALLTISRKFSIAKIYSILQEADD